MGYERAKTEEMVLHKQKNYRKYERMFEKYAFPIDQYKMNQVEIDDIKTAIEEERQTSISKI